MVATLSSQYFDTSSSQRKSRIRHRRPISKGARKMAWFHAEARIPACWKEKTIKTVEAMRRVQPRMSRCFHGLRGAEVIWCGLGQAVMNIAKGTMPMRGLSLLVMALAGGEENLLDPKHPSPRRIMRDHSTQHRTQYTGHCNNHPS